MCQDGGFKSCQSGYPVTLLFLFCLPIFAQRDLTRYVNPFIGTGGHGHTFPGAIVPFGMVQLSPDTRLTGWDGCSGYHYSDSIIYGFSHTHLSGTGILDYGDILLMPTVGGSPDDYKSAFQHRNETASPGYYAVKLDDDNIFVELTATARVGMHRYTFPRTNDANIIIDLTHRDKVIDAGCESRAKRRLQAGDDLNRGPRIQSFISRSSFRSRSRRTVERTLRLTFASMPSRVRRFWSKSLYLRWISMER